MFNRHEIFPIDTQAEFYVNKIFRLPAPIFDITKIGQTIAHREND